MPRNPKAEKKRKAEDEAVNSRKKPKNKANSAESTTTDINHPVLSCYYEHVVTLREYFIRFLASHPNARKFSKAVARLRSKELHLDIESTIQDNENLAKQITTILDTFLVGCTAKTINTRSARPSDLAQFSQQLQSSTNIPSSIAATDRDPDARLQVEVVNFVIWLIFRTGRHQHLLAQGYSRASGPGGRDGLPLTMAAGLPGVICMYPNDHVTTLTTRAWCTILRWAGRGADLAMVEMLLACAIFVPVHSSDGKQTGNYYQLSGRSKDQRSFKSIT
jgi:hypothetical protein